MSPGYGLAQQVDDLEAARKALGYQRINLVSESAGTRTALIYSWRYPKSIHRSVMIGANPPGNFVWDAKTTDEQIQRYSELCATDETCSARTDDLAASMRRVAADIPDRFGFLPIKEGNVRVASFYGLMESTSEAAPLSAPMTLASWLSAADGDASGFWFQSLLADMAFPKSFVWGQFASAAMPDAQAAREHFASAAGSATRSSAMPRPSPGAADAWPTHGPPTRTLAIYSRMRTSNTETLVISGELDFATPPQVATKELLPYLPKGHQVVLPGFGHSTSVWTEQPEAGSRLINTFFDSGKIDRSLYKPQKVDFTPEVSQIGARQGLRGHDGRPRAPHGPLAPLDGAQGAQARTLRTQDQRDAPLALRDRARPGRLVPRRPDRHHDDARRPAQPRAAGRPVHRRAGRPRHLPGHACTATGRPRASASESRRQPSARSPAPGWGSMQTVDLLALITAIVGAVVGANLTLILLDMSRAWSAEGRVAPATANTSVPGVEPA